MKIFFERVDDCFVDRSWMAMAYFDIPRRQKVMVMFPFHYLVRFVWWLNYLWNRYRHKESWIDKLTKERYTKWEDADCLEHTLKEIYNMAFFDWDTMPEEGKKEFQKQVLKMIDEALTNR